MAEARRDCEGAKGTRRYIIAGSSAAAGGRRGTLQGSLSNVGEMSGTTSVEGENVSR